jgi:hypothetical protein
MFCKIPPQNQVGALAKYWPKKQAAASIHDGGSCSKAFNHIILFTK